jgi:hypothetical protein
MRAYLDRGSGRGNRTESLFDYVDILRNQWRAHVSRHPSGEVDLIDNWKSLRAEIQTRRFWDDAGVEALKFERLQSDGHMMLWIGDKTYDAVLRKDSNGRSFVVAVVPRKKLMHPAWNPISDQERLGLAASPNLRFPDRYPVEVGQNGELFLLDGNKRSELDPRELVPIELPWPLKTSGWRRYFDHWGYAQPSFEEMQQLQNGLDPIELVRNRRSRFP